MSTFKAVLFFSISLTPQTIFAAEAQIGSKAPARTYNEAANAAALSAINDFHVNCPSDLPANHFLFKFGKRTMLANVKKAIFDGENPNLIIEEKTTLFSYILTYCDLEFFNHLVSAGADINTKSWLNQTPLMQIVFYRDATEITTALIAIPGVDINAQDKRGESALMQAFFYGNCAMVSALLAAGADVNAVDKQGQTALHWAAKRGHVDVLRALLGPIPTVEK